MKNGKDHAPTVWGRIWGKLSIGDNADIAAAVRENAKAHQRLVAVLPPSLANQVNDLVDDISKAADRK